MKLCPEELACWLAFHQLLNTGFNRLAKPLLRGYGSLRDAWRSGDILRDTHLPEGARLKIQEGRPRLSPERLLEDCQQRGMGILTILDEEYPPNLLQISEHPVMLYYYGKKALLNLPMIAVVGSRRCTGYGEIQAAAFSQALAEAGVCVVSGMAKGIDSQAHLGALRAGGATAAVLGCGADVVYPSENRKLYQQIRQEGLALSEFAPGTPAAAWRFPARNRIISGLCLGVLVIEGRAKSGALITAELAGEQGREVWALPGPVTNPASIGPLRLIQDGAALAISPRDILRDLGILNQEGTSIPEAARGKPSGQAALFAPAAPEIPDAGAGLPPAEAGLLNLISYTPAHVDELLVSAGISPGGLYLGLTNLVRLSLIERLPGDYYQRL